MFPQNYLHPHLMLVFGQQLNSLGETFLCTKPWFPAVLTWHGSASLDTVGQIHASGLGISRLITAPSLSWFGHGFLQSNSTWGCPLVGWRWPPGRGCSGCNPMRCVPRRRVLECLMDQHSCSQEEPRLLNPASFLTPGPCLMQHLEFLKRVCGLLERPSLPRGFIG